VQKSKRCIRLSIGFKSDIALAHMHNRLNFRQLIADCPTQLSFLIALSLLPFVFPRQAPAQPARSKQSFSPVGLRTERAFQRAQKEGSPALRAFFYAMPKGADLHSHLSGAVYAETFIHDAVKDNLCVQTTTLTFYHPATTTANAPVQLVCGDKGVPAATALSNQKLYDSLINVFSMRIFVPTAAESGHDHFFASFDHFRGLGHEHIGEWLDEVASRAAAQNEQYLELMQTPDLTPILKLGEGLGPVDMRSDFSQLRQQLLNTGLRSELPRIRAQFDDAEASRRTIERCGETQPALACSVQVRFIYQVLRALPQQAVFAQLVTGFELASADPLVVGINMVQPEDGRVAMADYRLQMKMIGALHQIYPRVHIALHAGELAPGMVPPDGLTFHIRSAVEEAHAQRIGHGVDIMHESDPYGLLREMAARHVLVEINLTSNDVILNVKGSHHPFPIYREYGVPVALSTDDEGVSRIDLTHEYVRAALAYPLTYADLKNIVRASLEHSFLPGGSLWQDSGQFETYDRARSVCRAQIGHSASGACKKWLDKNEKGSQQFELERRFGVFESKF
jgi:adenosine deaminase